MNLPPLAYRIYYHPLSYQWIPPPTFSFTMSLFVVLAFTVFGDGELNLTVFLGVMGSVIAIFFKNIPIDQFEKNALESALAYRVSRFRTIYDAEHDHDSGLFCFDKNKCGKCCGRNRDKGDDFSTDYHKWRSMALYKLLHNHKKKNS